MELSFIYSNLFLRLVGRFSKKTNISEKKFVEQCIVQDKASPFVISTLSANRKKNNYFSLQYRDLTKKGGYPWLNDKEHLPVCESCGYVMQLHLQINLDQISESAREDYGTGILQLFQCEESGCCNYDRMIMTDSRGKRLEEENPFVADGILLRIIDPEPEPYSDDYYLNEDLESGLPPNGDIVWGKFNHKYYGVPGWIEDIPWLEGFIRTVFDVDEYELSDFYSDLHDKITKEINGTKRVPQCKSDQIGGVAILVSRPGISYLFRMWKAYEAIVAKF